VTRASCFLDHFIATLAHCGLRVHRSIVSIAAFIYYYYYLYCFAFAPWHCWYRSICFLGSTFLLACRVGGVCLGGRLV
jgi:hypothetical protein